jgi:hypothetical protein
VVRFLSPDSDSRALGLGEMATVALEGGASAPGWIAIEERPDGLGRLMSSESGPGRARGVVATSRDDVLAVAHNLGIGGAVLLPPSSAGVADALHAASSAPEPPVINPCTLQLLDRSEDLKIVTVADRLFWQAQLGIGILSRLLAELAEALGSPQVLVPWPALVIARAEEAEIRDAWEPLASGPGRPTHDLVVVEAEAGGGDALAAVYRALVELDAGDRAAQPPLNPVHELPGGDRVGTWAPRYDGAVAADWVASPVETSGLCRWRLQGPDGDLFAQDVLDVEALTGLDGVAAARVPGSVGGAMRRGSPAGLLVHRLADAADRRHLPLWIPNVDHEGLKLALRLPGTLWIDGPAVPR